MKLETARFGHFVNATLTKKLAALDERPSRDSATSICHWLNDGHGLN